MAKGSIYNDSMNENRLIRESDDYHRIEKAIEFLEKNYLDHPDLDQIARSANLSKYHFQRLFKRWAGISPMQFLGYLTLEYARKCLAESQNLLDASYDAGLSGPGRLHDLFVTFDAVTPGEYKRMGEGLKIEYGFHPTRFGECLVAITRRGICHLGFVTNSREQALDNLRQNWPKSDLVENYDSTRTVLNSIFDIKANPTGRPFHLLVKGTNFQVNVWRALLTIPEGTLVSYRDIASLIGKPGSYRAVASAIAVNPVGYLIPCHRVIAKSGRFNQYRWGAPRKKIICGWEASQVGQDP